MDSNKFDDLTKVLATTTSRRNAFKALGVAAVGGIVGLVGISTAFAQPSEGRNCQQACTDCNPSIGLNCCQGLHCVNNICIDKRNPFGCIE